MVKELKYPKAIVNWPEDERPREKLLKYGAEKLSDAELLAILLRTGIKGKSVIEIAKEILESVGGSFKGLAGKIMGIDVLDHIIITKTKVFSFKEKIYYDK